MEFKAPRGTSDHLPDLKANWNKIEIIAPNTNFYFDPIIIHLAGIRKRDRLKFIKDYKHLFV